MNDHENRDAEPPRECPNSLKALVYFNFVLLFFVGIMFFGDLKNVDDLDEVGFLGLLYAFLFLFILAFAIRDGKPGGRLRSVAHLLLILVGPIGISLNWCWIKGPASNGENRMAAHCCTTPPPIGTSRF